MLKKITVICLQMFTMFLLVSLSWALDFVPGQYEITAKVEMPGMPSSPPPQTTTQCMTRQNPVATQSAASQDCQVTELVTRGNTVSWKMECNQHGQKMKSSGQMTYNGERFKGTIKTDLGPQAGNMTMLTVLNGKRIGDCR